MGRPGGLASESLPGEMPGQLGGPCGELAYVGHTLRAVQVRAGESQERSLGEKAVNAPVE